MTLFRIRPDRSRLYYTVRVFPTCAAMRQYAKPKRLGRSCRGVATSWTVVHIQPSGRERMSRHAGELLLVIGHLGSRIVTHECGHLALAWARRRRLDLVAGGQAGDVSADEERFCYALGDLVAATYRQLFRRRLCV
jgi:hypothetical protein